MILRLPHLALALCAAFALPARAQDIAAESYATLRAELDGIVTFETLPWRAEPGLNFDQALRLPGLWLGERFAGQSLAPGASAYDLPDAAAPAAPLTVRPGRPGENLSVAFHRGFGSNALFPLGPDGVARISGRGEGAVAILFDHDQYALGLRLHAQYPAPLGAAPETGPVTVAFFARDGRRLATLRHIPAAGVVALGWRRAGNRPDIAGILITNTDPGGIAIDDIIFQRTPPLG
jgi:hypothetical protein